MYKELELKQIFSGKKILIAGFGREGRSSYLLLKKLFSDNPQGITLAIADKNEGIKTDALLLADSGLNFYVGEEYLAASDEYDIILKSPGIPMFDFASDVSKDKVSSQTDVFLRVFGSQTIGITGTKGKSTTTNIIYNMMKEHNPNTIMAGNMGLPLFDCIESITENTILVLELSSHQLENITKAPHIGIVLNLFQEHLDHYNSYMEYKLAKLNIARLQSAGDIFIYCSDNAELDDLVKQTAINSIVLNYSMEHEVEKGCYSDGKYFCMMPGNNTIYDINKEKRYLQGSHNLSNCMAVFLVGHCFGISDDVIAKTISEFRGLEHRLEYVDEVAGVAFYNDSISTIPEATMAAIAALNNVDTLLLGGFDRGIDYESLIAFLSNSNVNNIAFIGEAGRRMFSLMEAINGLENRNYILSNSYVEIVDWCCVHTQKGKICLLSPAASSYDSFKNFEERGRVFKGLIQDKKNSIIQ